MYNNPNSKELNEQISVVGLFKNSDELIKLSHEILNGESNYQTKFTFDIPPLNKEKLHKILKENMKTDYSTIENAVREAYLIYSMSYKDVHALATQQKVREPNKRGLKLYLSLQYWRYKINKITKAKTS